jgi:hypothetical protein
VPHEAATVIAYNSTGRDVQVDPEFEPGVWRRAADRTGELERVRDGWRYADLAAPEEFLVLPHGTVRPVSHGSYLVRVVRQQTAARDPHAHELRDDMRELMELVVDRVITR